MRKSRIPFIDAGVPTFIEKPMATTVADAIRIYEAALRSGVPVVVGHVHLYNPAFQAAKKLLPEVETVQAVFWEGMNHQPRIDSSVLWDWLPHGLSMARALFEANPSFAQAWGVGEASRFKAASAKFVIADVPFIANTSWVSPLKRHSLTLWAKTARSLSTTPRRESFRCAIPRARRTLPTGKNSRSRANFGSSSARYALGRWIRPSWKAKLRSCGPSPPRKNLLGTLVASVAIDNL